MAKVEISHPRLHASQVFSSQAPCFAGARLRCNVTSAGAAKLRILLRHNQVQHTDNGEGTKKHQTTTLRWPYWIWRSQERYGRISTYPPRSPQGQESMRQYSTPIAAPSSVVRQRERPVRRGPATLSLAAPICVSGTVPLPRYGAIQPRSALTPDRRVPNSRLKCHDGLSIGVGGDDAVVSADGFPPQVRVPLLCFGTVVERLCSRGIFMCSFVQR